MKNKYKIDGQTLIVYNRKDNKEMLFDAEDFDLVKQYTWCIDRGYVVGNGIKAHRLIMKAKKGQLVDHRYHNTTDNRKCNLLLANHQINQHNRKTVKGYCWDKSYSRWKAYIKVDGKLIHIGRYNTETEARTAYLEAKKIYHPTAPIQGY
jgi:hypothetical protein